MDIPESSNFVQDIIVNDLSTGKRKSVHTRFPPEPNGYIHIGHAKSICLNFGTANKYKDFGGITNLRFDDTNPSKEDVEYVDSIREDVKWLGFEWKGGEYFASDYYDQIYAFAEKLIEMGKAYVEDLTRDEMQEYRGNDAGKPSRPSPYRDRSVEENMKLFREMRDGKYADGEKCLRAKVDLSSPNMNMRDPVIYRIKHCTHHRTGVIQDRLPDGIIGGIVDASQTAGLAVFLPGTDVGEHRLRNQISAVAAVMGMGADQGAPLHVDQKDIGADGVALQNIKRFQIRGGDILIAVQAVIGGGHARRLCHILGKQSIFVILKIL